MKSPIMNFLFNQEEFVKKTYNYRVSNFNYDILCASHTDGENMSFQKLCYNNNSAIFSFEELFFNLIVYQEYDGNCFEKNHVYEAMPFDEWSLNNSFCEFALKDFEWNYFTIWEEISKENFLKLVKENYINLKHLFKRYNGKEISFDIILKEYLFDLKDVKIFYVGKCNQRYDMFDRYIGYSLNKMFIFETGLFI